jgi:hypothetical protein
MKTRWMLVAGAALLAACGVEAGEAGEAPDVAPGVLAASGASAAVSPAAGRATRTPGVVRVQYRADATDAEKGRARGRATSRLVRTIHSNAMRTAGSGELEVVAVPAGTEDASAAAMAADPQVAYAEPEHLHRLDAIPPDPRFAELWGLHNTGQTANGQTGTFDVDIDWPEADDVPREGALTPTYMAVLDTGVDHGHPDLAGAVRNPLEISNRRDDDGNGKKNDLQGWDFVNDDASVYDGWRRTRTGLSLDERYDVHGTHVAGTIAALRGNGQGITGVASPETGLVVGKVCEYDPRQDDTSCFSTAEIEAIDYMIDLKQRGANIVAINASWGGNEFDQGLYDAIGRARAAGILFVAAAGNDATDNDARPHYPASYDHDNIISVAAHNQSGRPTGFTNWGAHTVDVAAPGKDVLSTLPNGKYGFMNGTSMAAPHVTGVCAMLAARGVSVWNIRTRLFLSVVVNTSHWGGLTATQGRLNAYRAVAEDYVNNP